MSHFHPVDRSAALPLRLSQDYRVAADRADTWTNRLAGLDEDVVALDQAGFEADLSALRPRLRAYAKSLARDNDWADDLVQDTLLRAWSARTRFVPGTNLKAWTFTILRNVFLNQHRRSRFEGDCDEHVAQTRLACPETQTVSVELDRVLVAIGRLPEDQRAVVQLVGIDGASYEQASGRLGITVASVRSRLRRSRVALAAILAGDRPHRGARIDHASRESAGTNLGAWAAAKAAGRPLWIG